MRRPMCDARVQGCGVPGCASGVELPLSEPIESLETIGGAHRIRRIDVVENRLPRTNARKVCEAPAVVLPHGAHRELDTLVIPRGLERVRHNLSRVYADLVYNGLWFSHTRQTIDAFAAAVQPRVTGGVRLKAFKGDSRVGGRKSPFWASASDSSTAEAPALQAH